jgi:AraC-like DNA-binding protein
MLLDRLLGGLEISVEAFAICEVRREANLVVQDDRSVSVHYVLSGEGVARSLIGPAIPLRPHQVVIAPPGACLVVGCESSPQMTLPTPRCRPLPGGWKWATVGEGAPGLVMACGAVRATHRQAVGLFDYLRVPLAESVEDEPAFREPFHRLLTELSDPQPGTRLLAQVLMKQCLIVLLRRQCESGEVKVPWLAALEHPLLGKAVGAIVERPESDFTLQGLAEISGMSRATFAQRFREAFGRTAMDFVKEVRLRRAADLLCSSDLPVKTIAARVGFASRSHFSRAFKAHMGSDPASYRARAFESRAAPEEPQAPVVPIPIKQVH